MTIVWTIIIGFLAGLIARFIKPGRDQMGMIFTTLLGIAGALIAQFLGQGLGWHAQGEPAGFLASVVGAILVLWLTQAVRRTAP
jgi:uncharacterized membrane protein YeaQ/YmgE (transglycosylase-associated protein family)